MIGIGFIDDLISEVGMPLVKIGVKALTGIDLESKELFRQFEKHIDGRFDGVEAGLKQILNLVQKD